MKDKVFKYSSRFIVATLIVFHIGLNLMPKINVEAASAIPKGAVVVDCKGTGKYKSVVEAVKKEKEGTIIYIKSGTYQGTIQAFNKEITLIGENKNTVILTQNNGSYIYPVINGSCGYFENLTIYSKYKKGKSKELNSKDQGAYAFHCESEYGVGKTLEFKNCKLISDFFPALGIGMRKDFTLIANNCQFVSNQKKGQGVFSTSGLGALYIHDSNGKLGAQKMIINNCSFKSKLNNVITLFDQKKSGNTVECVFRNNTLKSKVSKKNLVWFKNQINPFDGNFELSNSSYGNNVSILN